MEELLKNILENILLSIGILVGTWVSYYIKRYIDKSKFEQKKELVAIAVRFVEQAYKDYHGEEKYNKAVHWVKLELDKFGIKYTEEELKGLIESTLKIIQR